MTIVITLIIIYSKHCKDNEAITMLQISNIFC